MYKTIRSKVSGMVRLKRLKIGMGAIAGPSFDPFSDYVVPRQITCSLAALCYLTEKKRNQKREREPKMGHRFVKPQIMCLRTLSAPPWTHDDESPHGVLVRVLYQLTCGCTTACARTRTWLEDALASLRIALHRSAQNRPHAPGYTSLRIAKIAQPSDWRPRIGSFMRDHAYDETQTNPPAPDAIIVGIINYQQCLLGRTATPRSPPSPCHAASSPTGICVDAIQFSIMAWPPRFCCVLLSFFLTIKHRTRP